MAQRGGGGGRGGAAPEPSDLRRSDLARLMDETYSTYKRGVCRADVTSHQRTHYVRGAGCDVEVAGIQPPLLCWLSHPGACDNQGLRAGRSRFTRGAGLCRIVRCCKPKQRTGTSRRQGADPRGALRLQRPLPLPQPPCPPPPPPPPPPSSLADTLDLAHDFYTVEVPPPAPMPAAQLQELQAQQARQAAAAVEAAQAAARTHAAPQRHQRQGDGGYQQRYQRQGGEGYQQRYQRQGGEGYQQRRAGGQGYQQRGQGEEGYQPRREGGNGYQRRSGGGSGGSYQQRRPGGSGGQYQQRRQGGGGYQQRRPAGSQQGWRSSEE